MNLIWQYNLITEGTNKRGDIEGRPRAEVLEECADISIKSFERYAQTIGAVHLSQYVPIETEDYVHDYSPFFEVMNLVNNVVFDDYDLVLFCDSDIYANTNENIFDLFEEGVDVLGVLESDIVTQMGGGYNSWDFDAKKMRTVHRKYDVFECPVIPACPPNRPSRVTVMNTGMMIWSKEARIKARQEFTNWKNWVEEGNDPMWLAVDQMYLSAMFMKHDFELQTVNQTWNETPSGFNDDSWRESKFIHYTGGKGKADMIRDFKEKQFKYYA
jgi:hypothetical protein